MEKLRIQLDTSRTGREAEFLSQRLHQYIVGQEEAIGHIVNIYQMYLTGMAPPGRPIGNFLFLGPTGSGKTRIVEATAEILVSNPRALIKIDCGEFQHSHEICKLIGSPPGYLGHRETHPLLSQEVLNLYQTDSCKISFVLFDEIEKASDALWNLLLGILDRAILTLGDNRRVDFSKAMIFMTSNLGATEANSVLAPRLGFNATKHADTRNHPTPDNNFTAKISRISIKAAHSKFTPEFINRLDKMVVFRSLGEEELRQILDIELGMVQQRMLNTMLNNPFVFTVCPNAKEHLLKEGTDVKYGARHLKRAIERLIVQPMSNLIATDQVRHGDLLQIEFDELSGKMIFYREAEGLSMQSMADLLPRKAAAAGAGAPTARSSRRL